ncbi:hypothetical protein RchiOBHm_Chr6g0278561 [Rosa chinensis]|uniref:Nardilysin n=1 Tax=Rosa chinensis TaxID=74649 RepID=A0A2P6PSS4_ROSCH|nr:hypothetical protein RchiOBHm_Chr6g0278561 [Rosa chinensis]
MKLVVIGGESLDVLENWVLELFGNIIKGPHVNLEFKAEGPIWKAGKLYTLEAVKDVQWERRGSSQYTQADIDQVQNKWGKFGVIT